MATKTAVIILCEVAVLIWAIPALSPQPPDFSNHNPICIPPLFTIPFPDAIQLQGYSKCIQWNTISSWYFGSSQPLYFDMLCGDSKLQRFQIMLELDLSTTSLHVIKIPELTPYDFKHIIFQDYRICEDTLVSCWFNSRSHINNLDQYQCGVYTGSTSACFANVISHGGPVPKMLLPDIGRECCTYWCPASGRFVLKDISNRVAVLDFFWYILII